MAKIPIGARSELFPNPRDWRGQDQAPSEGLPRIVIGREVIDNALYSYLEEVRQINQGKREVQVLVGPLFAHLVTPESFEALILPGDLHPSKGGSARRAAYQLRNAKRAVAGAFSGFRKLDRELADKKYAAFEELRFEDPDAYDDAKEAGLVKEQPHEYERWPATSARIRRQPVRFSNDTLGLSIVPSVDQAEVNERVMQALGMRGISERQISLAGIAKFSALKVPILRTVGENEPDRIGEEPVMPIPPATVALGPMVVMELSKQ